MFCKKCNQQIPDDSKFCPNCGSTEVEANAPSSEAPVENANEATAMNTSDTPQDFGANQNDNTTYQAEASVQYTQTQGGRQQYQETQYGAPQRASFNYLAITGFVCSLVSLFFNKFFIFSILAIVFSAVGLRKISQTGERGRGMAIAGLIIGIVGIALTLILLVLGLGLGLIAVTTEF